MCVNPQGMLCTIPWYCVFSHMCKETELFIFIFYFFKRFYYLFLERGEGREKDRERNINVWLPLACPLLGTWPATQVCALTGNRTGNPLVVRPALNPLSHPSQCETEVLMSR